MTDDPEQYSAGHASTSSSPTATLRDNFVRLGRHTVRRFDTRALYEALDHQRTARRLTWEAVAREIGVSATTIKRTRRGGRMEVDGMLAMVGWLGVPVEAFVREVDV